MWHPRVLRDPYLQHEMTLIAIKYIPNMPYKYLAFTDNAGLRRQCYSNGHAFRHMSAHNLG
jgi:hypothetical protein